MGGLFHRWRHPRRCYVVCAIARSGSNFLTDGLRATRRAGRPKQYFLPAYEATYKEWSGINTSDFATYVREIIPATMTSNEVFAFKLMGWYLEEFFNRLRATNAFNSGAESSDLTILRNAFPQVKFVQIVRQNKVRQAVSKARAAQTGLWKVQERNAATGEAKFDPELIANCIEDTLREERIWTEFFTQIGVEPLQIIYEELCEDYASTIARILDFLEIRLPRNARPKPETIRQTDALSHEWEERFLALDFQGRVA